MPCPLIVDDMIYWTLTRVPKLHEPFLRMRLRELHIKNFRKIQDLTIIFPPGLAVIVGENNSGKTAIIDALRLMLFSSRDFDALRLNEDDFRTGTDYAPLRDPESGLKPSRNSQIAKLLDRVTKEEDRPQFETIAKGANERIRELEPVMGIVRLNGGGCNQTVPAAYSTDAHLRLSLSSSSLPRRDHQSLRLVIFSLRPELPRCRRNVSDARCLPQL